MCVCALQLSADWERTSLQPTSQPSGGFKSSPVIGTYATEGFINSNLVSTEEESQEFDDLIFALKTGEDAVYTFSLIYVSILFSFYIFSHNYFILPQSGFIILINILVCSQKVNSLDEDERLNTIQ